MLYLVAILIPPLAVLMAGKPFQALINVVLTLLLWVPGMIHALLVVANFYADRRTERVVRAVRQTPAAPLATDPVRLVAPPSPGRPLECPRCGTVSGAHNKRCPQCAYFFSLAARREARGT